MLRGTVFISLSFLPVALNINKILLFIIMKVINILNIIKMQGLIKHLMQRDISSKHIIKVINNMDEGYRNISKNVTYPSETCRILFLGTIVPWNLAVYIYLTVTALISNVLLLFSMCKDPLKCFRNPTSYFIANLAVADLLGSMFHLEELLLSQTTMYNSTYCLPGVWDTIHLQIGGFMSLLTYPSLTILALERYMSVAYPLWHKVNVTTRLCVTSIAVVWLLCLFSAGVGFHHNPYITFAFAVGFGCVFYIATVVIYILAYKSIRKQTSTLITGYTESENMKRVLKFRLKNQKRFLSTILIVNWTLTFALIPPFFSMVWKYFVPISVIYENDLQVLYCTCDILFLLNMAANPFLYMWRLPKYRKTFLVLFCNKACIDFT